MLPFHGFGAGLSPGTLSAPGHLRPVSYYALFQGWLLLSQPPGCHCARTSLSTQSRLGDLSRWSGLLPSRRRIFAPAVSLQWSRLPAFGVWCELVSWEAPASLQCSTSGGDPPGCPSRHFGENQLSPGSIGISPLPTTHPRLLQQTSVRPSTRSYPRFSLVMGSSPGFGSSVRD
jgi:hypothetical protein